MILERLAVRAFGCFREPVEFTFDERFNIVAGKNEAGKTTLFRALHHALFTPYGSSASEVRDLVPWGTELSPEVTVEFRVNGERFRLVKSFLHQARCALLEWDSDRFRDLADGDKAEERVRAYLLGERPGSGAAQSRHRGLGRLLWIPQGETELPELDGDVRRRIEQSLDAMTLDEAEGKLLAVISTSFNGIWAKNGKSFVKSSGLPALENELDDLRARRAELAASLLAGEQSRARLQVLEAEYAALKDEKQSKEREFEELDSEVKRVRELKMKLLAEQAELAEAKARVDRLRHDRERLRKLKTEAKEASEALENEIGPKLAQVGRTLEDAKAKRDDARRALLEAEQSVNGARAAWQRARRLREAMDSDAAIEKRARLIEEVEALSRHREKLDERLARMANPSDAQIQRARSLETELQRIAAKFEAVGIRVSFSPERGVSGDIRKDGGEASDYSANAPDRIEVVAARSVEWRIEGVGTFAIESGAEEAAALERERDRTALELKELLAPFDADFADELMELRQARRAVEQEKAALEARARQMMRDEGSLEALRSGVAELERKVIALCRDLEIERSALGEVEPPDVGRAEEAVVAWESRYAAIRQEQERAASLVDRLQAQVSAVEKDRALWTQKLDAAERDIAQLLGGYGSEEDLAIALGAASEEYEACHTRVRAITAKLPPEDEDPERRAAELKAGIRELDEDLNNRSIAMAKLHQQLESIADSGTYEALARLEEAIRLKEEEYERQVRRAKSIKLLKALADARQKSVLDQLTEPVSNRVTRYFEQVTGEIRRIRFDGSLHPTQMDVGRAEAVPTSALSTGAREQLHILSRLALGRYLASKHGRMLFVLDDSFVNTDAARRRRFLDLLFEAQEDLQIVLLTCHSEWYRGLEGVRRLSLESA